MPNAKSNTLSVYDFEMHYEIHGEGYPLLLLHGFTGSCAGLESIFNQLTKTHQLIIPDLRGHGRSTNPSNKFTFHQAALDIFALLEHLNIKQCSAVGFSGGGCTLLQMSYLQPNKIKSMAIVSAAPYFPQSARNIMRQVTVENRTEEDWNAMRKIHFHGDEQIKMLWKQANLFSESYDDLNFTPEKLSKITTKTLIVQGDRDPFYPLDLTIDMFKHIPNAYLWIIPNSGHGPIPVSGALTQAFINYLIDYL